MRWVLDTNVLLDWLIFREPTIAPLVAAIEAGAVTLLNNTACRDEFVRVLDYPQVVKRGAARATALTTYDARHAPCAGVPAATPLPVCRDPDDQKFLELARDGQADWLISKDRALLELARRVRGSMRFEVLSPREALLRLQGRG